MNIKAHLGFAPADINGILIPCELQDSTRSPGSTSGSTAGLNRDGSSVSKDTLTVKYT